MPLDKSDRRYIVPIKEDFEKLVNAVKKQISASGSNHVKGHTRCQIENLQHSVAVLVACNLYGARHSIREMENLLPSFEAPTIVDDFTSDNEFFDIPLDDGLVEPSDTDKVKSLALELIDFELHTEFEDRLKEKGL